MVPALCAEHLVEVILPAGSCLSCRAAYKEETRTTILTLDRVSKTVPSGKQILKDIGLGMYKGAKIGNTACTHLSLHPIRMQE